MKTFGWISGVMFTLITISLISSYLFLQKVLKGNWGTRVIDIVDNKV